LLGAGVITGAVIAAITLMFPTTRTDTLAGDVIATVDGRPILREHYERALAAVAADRRGPLDQRERRRVLDRLIDEELLIGRALELELASRDRRVRANLAAAMLDVVRAQSADAPASLEELRTFHTAEAHRFRRPPRIHIEHAFFASADEDAGARGRAEAAIASGDPSATADAFALPVPDGPVPLSTLARLLGPTPTRGIAELEEGTVGGPWRGSGGYHVARVLARIEGEVTPFEEIVAVVREEHARVAAEQRLRDLLAEERARARIEVGE
jgi:hypothetical protein